MNKKFDCVEMKNKIQEKLLQEQKNHSPDEWKKIVRKKISENSVFSALWTKFIMDKKIVKKSA